MQIHYDIVSFPFTIAETASNVFAVISKYSNRFTYTEGSSSIRADDSFDITFYTHSSTNKYSIDGTATQMLNNNSTYTVTIIVTDTIFYFLCKTNDAANTPVGGFCWIKERGINYLGVSTLTSVGQIELMNFSDKTTQPENRYYKVKKHADFSLIGDNIVLLTTSLIADNGGNYTVLSDLRSCSTVNFNTMLAINRVNYYAIGTNTLLSDS